MKSLYSFNVVLVVLCILLNSSSAQYELLKKIIKVSEIDVPADVVAIPSITISKISSQWPFGIVPYFIDTEIYDIIVHRRIQRAMQMIESLSCIIFRELLEEPEGNATWLHVTNPEGERNCQHEIKSGEFNEFVVVIGFDCMKMADIVHILLHALGFNDEVTHPLRDQFIRVIWENIQPQYRYLFKVHPEQLPYKLVEYDPMSVMHFHDRAYSSNGGVTTAPLLPGMIIRPSDRLSQLDIMKLHMAFSHECNKRKVEDLVDHCKETFYEQLHGSDTSNSTEDVTQNSTKATNQTESDNNENDDNGGDEGNDGAEGGDGDAGNDGAEGDAGNVANDGAEGDDGNAGNEENAGADNIQNTNENKDENTKLSLNVNPNGIVPLANENDADKEIGPENNANKLGPQASPANGNGLMDYPPIGNSNSKQASPANGNGLMDYPPIGNSNSKQASPANGNGLMDYPPIGNSNSKQASPANGVGLMDYPPIGRQQQQQASKPSQW